eukprot:4878103-Amphidinium_carterae.1
MRSRLAVSGDDGSLQPLLEKAPVQILSESLIIVGPVHTWKLTLQSHSCGSRLSGSEFHDFRPGIGRYYHWNHNYSKFNSEKI